MQIKITTGRMTQFVSAIIAATGMVKTTSDASEARNFYEQSGKRALKLVKKTFKKSTVEALDVPHAPRGRAIAHASAPVTMTAKRGRPPGSKNKPKATGKRGRPLGSKTRMKKPGYSINGIKLGRPPAIGKKVAKAKTGKRRGRPPGSKNKPKAPKKAVKKVVKAPAKKVAPKAAPKAKAKPVRKAKAAPAPATQAPAAPAAPAPSTDA